MLAVISNWLLTLLSVNKAYCVWKARGQGVGKNVRHTWGSAMKCTRTNAGSSRMHTRVVHVQGGVGLLKKYTMGGWA